MKMLEAQVGTTLVYDDGEYSIWWNNSATFNVWLDDVERDCFTRYGVTLDQAVAAAEEYMSGPTV